MTDPIIIVKVAKKDGAELVLVGAVAGAEVEAAPPANRNVQPSVPQLVASTVLLRGVIGTGRFNNAERVLAKVISWHPLLAVQFNDPGVLLCVTQLAKHRYLAVRLPLFNARAEV